MSPYPQLEEICDWVLTYEVEKAEMRKKGIKKGNEKEEDKKKVIRENEKGVMYKFVLWLCSLLRRCGGN